MFRNYFKTAWRNLLKNKTSSFVNISGLAVGMAVALLIGLWIWDEISFDHYHQNHATLAQVWDTQTWNGETGTGPGIDIPLANELRSNYSNDFKAAALASAIEDGHIFATGDKKISSSGMWAQPQLPSMLTLKMIEGSRNALTDPSSILLSSSLAKTLFGDADPMNKTIQLDKSMVVKVEGVFEDLPHNTSLYASKFFLTWDKFLTTQSKDAQTQWGNHGYRLFVQVNDNEGFDKVTAKIKDIPQKHLKEGKEEILLHPMDKWHLYSEFRNGKVAGGQIQFVWLFGIIGVFVLLLACINFMNLGTARSEKRAKEVGIRKAIGSLQRQLVGQFLSESLVMTFFAFFLAIIMVILSLPFFNELAHKQMSVPWINPVFWLFTLGFTLFTGLVSGSYPAFYLSGFKPIKVLKGNFRIGRFASLPRKILVVVQFTVSVTLIICTIIVFRQIQFAKSRPVGYTREGLITVSMNTTDMASHYNAIRNDLIQTGSVEDMAQSSSPETAVDAALTGFDWRGKDPNSAPLFGAIGVTHDFGKTIGWKITEGRDFSRNFPADSGAFILNESAAKLTSLKNPVGEMIKFNGTDHQVIGIVKDMVMESPYSPVSPTIFVLDYRWANFITIRIRPSMPASDALNKIESVFKKYNPGSPFGYQFTDEEYAKKFSDEVRIGNLARIFAILAIFISCLGLFGLASFVAEQRIKEIGIRKVLGASVLSVWHLLSKDFVVLVIISFLIAVPTSYYFMHSWLQNYNYRTEISWWIFVASGIGSLVITVLVVSFQAIKAAIANPVKSLRTE